MGGISWSSEPGTIVAPNDVLRRVQRECAQTSPRPFIPRPAPPEWKSAEESYHEYCERIRRQEWEAAQGRPCTCHPDLRPDTCQHKYAYSECWAAAHAETSPRHPVAADGEQNSRILALPTDSDERKKLPVATGVVDYFPDAFVAIAELSRIGNDKHNPGMPLHWSRGKSDDHPDALMRHFIERGKVDVNGVRHSTQVAWRALAILQLELEKAAIDAMEENAWRLRPGLRIDNYKLNDPVADPDDPLRFTAAAMRSEWRQGDAVRARGWPDIPEEAVGLPCDVERP